MSSTDCRSRSHPESFNDSSSAVRDLSKVAWNPTISSHSIERRTGCHWELFSSTRYHPYHVSLCQTLLPGDYNKWMEFCRWVLNMINETSNFAQHIIWTDKAHFSRNAQVFLQNVHYWSTWNPHWITECRHQYQWTFHAWVSVYNRKMLSPVFFNTNVTGNIYSSEILQGFLSDFGSALSLSERLSAWYQHDGAPPPSSCHIVQFLDRPFGDKWAGHFGPVPWPARSPDLTRFLFVGPH